jgi:hypothetical protein
MADRYFEKFKNIAYANNIVVDITQRTVILNTILNNPYLFYPYDISDNERPDQISDRYYNDEYMSWLIYMSNKTYDPYYQWYLNDDEFTKYLKKKYNSNIYDLQQKIVFYRNNWYQSSEITVATYNALSSDLYRYWEPDYASGSNRIISYKRKQADWITSTNFVVSYTVNSEKYISNEIVDIYMNGTKVSQAQVCGSSSNTLFVQHVAGSVINTFQGSCYIVGRESNANNLWASCISIANNIPSAESSYWSPVSIFDQEMEKNESYKTIKLLDSSYASQTAKQLKSLLK